MSDCRACACYTCKQKELCNDVIFGDPDWCEHPTDTETCFDEHCPGYQHEINPI